SSWGCQCPAYMNCRSSSSRSRRSNAVVDIPENQADVKAAWFSGMSTTLFELFPVLHHPVIPPGLLHIHIVLFSTTQLFRSRKSWTLLSRAFLRRKERPVWIRRWRKPHPLS